MSVGELQTILPAEAERILTLAGYRVAEDASKSRQATERGRTSWAALDMGHQEPPPEPEFLHRADGAALLYRGRVHYFQGEPESLKSWVAQVASVEAIWAGLDVVYIDFEDEPKAAAERLRALGATDQELGTRLHYVRPEEPLSKATEPDFAELLALPLGLAVIDGVTEAMSLHGLDPIKNLDVATFHAMLPRPIADAGAAVVLIDHVTKDPASRGRFALGAGHKLAGVDGAAYRFDLLQPASRAGFGLARIEVVKDRPGYVRAVAGQGGRVAEFYLVSEGGSVRAELRTPVETQNGMSPAMRRILAVLPQAGKGEVTVREIGDRLAEDGLGPPLRTRTIQKALNDLAEQGLADGTSGDVRTAGRWWRSV